MASPACYGKEMLGWIHEKMAIQELALKGGRLFSFDLISVRNGALTCNSMCAVG